MKLNDLNEKKRRGKTGFPIEYHLVDDTHPRYQMPLHWHNDFEIIRIKSGEFYASINNIGYTLQSGDVLLICPGMMHRGEAKNCIYECIVFDLEILRRQETDECTLSSIHKLLSDDYVTDCHLSQDDGRIYRIVSELFSKMVNASEYYELSVCGLLYEFFGLVFSEKRIRKTGVATRYIHKNTTVALLVEWIEKNYQNTIRLVDLARFSGLNEKYLCRLFKDYTGHTPIDYINSVRIREACYSIANGNTITEAALSCGFNDLSYFSKTFKKQKGITPIQYKKMLE